MRNTMIWWYEWYEWYDIDADFKHRMLMVFLRLWVCLIFNITTYMLVNCATGLLYIRIFFYIVLVLRGQGYDLLIFLQYLSNYYSKT